MLALPVICDKDSKNSKVTAQSVKKQSWNNLNKILLAKSHYAQISYYIMTK